MLLIWISENPARANESAMGAIMQINKIIETSVGADVSALICINRTNRRGDLDGRPWVGRADRSFRPQQGTGPLPPPAGDHQGHPYGSSGFLPLFMA